MPSQEAARLLACVEIGATSTQTALFRADEPVELKDGVERPDGSALAVAVPGIIANGLVRHASNLGWCDIDPVSHLGLDGPAEVVLNDAEAAALGEAALRGREGLNRLVYMCVGTGIGGAVVHKGRVARSNLFGHNAPGYGTKFGDRPCRCERVGCLETVAAGWALPDPLSDHDLREVAADLSIALRAEPLAAEGPVVIGGGIARRYPQLIEFIADRLDDRVVGPSSAPPEAKSAAPWGLRYSLTGAISEPDLQ
jgi:predicted NBD/HSP70 family sugar kinase